jgi:hypothetical protein
MHFLLTKYEMFAKLSFEIEHLCEQECGQSLSN